MLILGVNDRDIGDPGVVCFESLERGKFGAIQGEYLISSASCSSGAVVVGDYYSNTQPKTSYEDVLIPKCASVPADAPYYALHIVWDSAKSTVIAFGFYSSTRIDSSPISSWEGYLSSDFVPMLAQPGGYLHPSQHLFKILEPRHIIMHALSNRLKTYIDSHAKFYTIASAVKNHIDNMTINANTTSVVFILEEMFLDENN